MSLYAEHKAKAMAACGIVSIPIAVWILFRENWHIIEWAGYWWEFLICMGLCMFASMIPDTDVASTSRRIVYTILVILITPIVVRGYYRTAAVIGGVAMLPNILPHRHKFGPHSTPVMMLLFTPLLIIPALTGKWGLRQIGITYYVGALAGHISHITIDHYKEKVPVKSAKSKKKFHIRPHFWPILVMYLITAISAAIWILLRQSWNINILLESLRKILICLAICAFSAKLPKIDIMDSWRKELYGGAIHAVILLMLLGYYQIAAIIALIAMLPNLRKINSKKYRRRSYLFAAAIPMPLLFISIYIGEWDVWQLDVPYYVAAVCGYMSHIISVKQKY